MMHHARTFLNQTFWVPSEMEESEERDKLVDESRANDL
jgi:hypothetical protein